MSRLFLVENLLAREIVVLTPRNAPQHSALLNMGLPHGIRFTSDPVQVGKRNVLLSTIADFKGLERPVVLVAELDGSLPSDPRQRAALLYVAFSRPRNVLSIFANPSLIGELSL